MKNIFKKLKKDRKIIFILLGWILLTILCIWNIESLFILLAPLSIFLLLTFPILLIYLIVQTIRKKISIYPLIVFILFSIFLYYFPYNAMKSKLYYETHKNEFKQLELESKKRMKDDTLNDERLLLDNTGVTVFIKNNHYYLLIPQNTLLLQDPTEWIVYTSNDSLTQLEDFMTIYTQSELDKHYYYVTSEIIVK